MRDNKQIRHIVPNQPVGDEAAYTQAYVDTYGTRPPEPGAAAENLPEEAPLMAAGMAGGASPDGVRPERQPIIHKRKKNPSKAKKIILWVLLVLLLAVVAMGIKYIVDINNPQNLFAQSTPLPAETPKATPAAATAGTTATPEPTIDPESLLMAQAAMAFMKNRVNVLVLGVAENNQPESWGSFRTDTMILVTVNFDSHQVHMISIPRDSYIKIYDHRGENELDEENNPVFDKINSAFSTGGGAQKRGFAFAMQTVSHLFGGIPIDYYMAFNMNVVKEMVDAMGGVDYDVDVEVQMNGRVLSVGPQHLDGQGVLDYCRLRHGSSDIARVDRQQRILMAIFQQMKSTGQIKNIPAIYQALQENIQTNLSFTQISSLALLALRMDFEQLQRDTVPGQFMTVDKRSCWGVDTNKLEKMIKRVFGASVSVDNDMDAENILLQIENNRALIATELALANNALSKADHILKDYRDWLVEETYQTLKQARDQLQEAVEEESKELLDYYTPPVQQLCDTILAQLQQYGEGMNAGQAVSETPAA